VKMSSFLKSATNFEKKESDFGVLEVSSIRKVLKDSAASKLSEIYKIYTKESAFCSSSMEKILQEHQTEIEAKIKKSTGGKTLEKTMSFSEGLSFVDKLVKDSELIHPALIQESSRLEQSILHTKLAYNRRITHPLLASVC